MILLQTFLSAAFSKLSKISQKGTLKKLKSMYLIAALAWLAELDTVVPH
jgi:hypothetical protein